ncbi:flagellar basal body-associated protein FliL [Pseudoalteromonas sp. T1lg48]|uniref:flagellar basal body-associated protein FliL n=1 Tax=Pseudoalteromonas sp. T1lg48 TaxID=2077100 RepID=UPI000CF618C3|nr:flagellar basal body-associated protein FliL [Pseudoalteromonas sp. T1lg48]
MRFATNLLFALILLLTIGAPKKAAADVGYYGFEPDIVANYISISGRKLGYVRVTVDLMLEDINNLAVVEHHMPLLRDAIVEILSQEPEEKIKSLSGREEIRQKCLERINTLLQQETGQDIIRDLLFTKYLYH